MFVARQLGRNRIPETGIAPSRLASTYSVRIESCTELGEFYARKTPSKIIRNRRKSLKTIIGRTL